ncbi:MAG: TIGR01777 family protein [Saprospiraceae bacterium]|nr:TIGR01777 family protein [Saprospiraceae bacterium]
MSEIDSKANIILLVGGSGLIGRHLQKYLESKGYEIRILSRQQKPARDNYYHWDSNTGYINKSAFIGNPIIINLSGENIATYWTTESKKRILQSRILSIQTLKNNFIKERIHSPLIINASAIGIYGDCKENILDEDSAISRKDFMSEVVAQWEDEADTLDPFCSRLIKIRIGLVLSNESGVWPKLLIGSIFRVLNWFGNGSQYYSWVHIDDLCRSIEFLIRNNSNSGVYNITAPKPVTQKTLIHSISKVNQKVYLMFGIPAWLLRLVVGEMSQIVLQSQRVIPKRLQSNGFHFQYEDIESAIKVLLKK